MDLTTTLLIILGVIVVVAIIGVVIAKSAHKGAQTGEKPAIEASEATAAAEGEPQDAEHKQEAEEQAQAVAATENKPKAEPQQTAEPQPEAEPAAQPEAAAQPETAAQPEPVVNPEPAAKPEIVKPENSQSRLVRLRSKLAHSANPFGKALFSILSRDHLSEEDWEDVEDTLLLADVGAEASEKIVDELRQDSRAQGTRSAEEVRDMLRERLLDAVGRDTDRSLEALSNNKPEAVAKTQKNGEAKPKAAAEPAAAEQTAPAEQARPLHVIIMVGVNGTGKTQPQASSAASSSLKAATSFSPPPTPSEQQQPTSLPPGPHSLASKWCAPTRMAQTQHLLPTTPLKKRSTTRLTCSSSTPPAACKTSVTSWMSWAKSAASSKSSLLFRKSCLCWTPPLVKTA